MREPLYEVVNLNRSKSDSFRLPWRVPSPLPADKEFRLAYLLANPPAEPIHASDLAAQVYDLFCEHPDFRQAMHWVCRDRDDQRIAKILLHKQRALETILASPDELDPVKTEALRELEVLYRFEKGWFTQIADISYWLSGYWLLAINLRNVRKTPSGLPCL